MSFNFSALQFEHRFRATGLNNWEYPRFSPPRPRSQRLNASAVCEKNGRLLSTARRDGNSFGHYRGTYELPLRITRSFIRDYDACLSGRHKYRDYPRDLCSCTLHRHACDQRSTLGTKGDPYWTKPTQCQNKCEGLKQLVALHERSRHCKRRMCQGPKEGGAPEKLIKMPKSTVLQKSVDKKKNRKRQVTAFAKKAQPKASGSGPGSSGTAKTK